MQCLRTPLRARHDLAKSQGRYVCIDGKKLISISGSVSHIGQPHLPLSGLIEAQKKLKIGSPLDFSTFTSAVIDQTSFKRISQDLKYAKSKHTILAGGETDSTHGWYIDPTIVQVQDPDDR